MTPTGYSPKSYPVPKGLHAAYRIVGGLSNPSKMPGHSYSLPAVACNIGSILAAILGSVCSGCYALSGCYQFPSTVAAMARRLQSIYHPQWVPSMALLVAWVATKTGGFFRWHDSGDLQSLAHFCNIVNVAVLTPNVTHWLPTKEAGILAEYRQDYGNWPKNLVVRLSAPMVGQPARSGMPGSTVHLRKGDPVDGSVECRAYTTEGHCAECRKCWDADTHSISYPIH